MTKESATQLMRSAYRGNDVAQMILATDFWDGNGVIPKNYKQAVYWGRRSAEQGNLSAFQFVQAAKGIIAIDPAHAYSQADRDQMEAGLEWPLDQLPTK